MRIASWIAVFLATGCVASSHVPEAAQLGTPAGSQALIDSLASPGPIEFEKHVVADWAVALSGLVNLEHPAAQAAGLEDRSEAIQIYLYVLRHPEFGTYWIDSGVETGFRNEASSEHVGALVRAALNTDRLEVHRTSREWLDEQGGRIDGVFLTHIHVDHIMGVPDLPQATPIVVGPGEMSARAFLNLFSRATTDSLLGEDRPLYSWRFEPDPDERFEGVLDVFGDGSLWAIHVPGHTPGSTAFVVRAADGAHLLTGDASHTSWGWENGVEPGTFSLDGPRSAASLAQLRQLATEVPSLQVHPGHQPLGTAASP